MYQNITDYSFSEDSSSPEGVALDTNGWPVDAGEIDARVRQVEACLGTEIPRDCLHVVIASDWYVSPCTGVALFPCDMPQEVCDAKEMPGQTEACPCACRSIVQNYDTIVTTPELSNFAGELARLVSGNNAVWFDETVNGCLGDPS
jgi:hypothetical protein